MSDSRNLGDQFNFQQFGERLRQERLRRKMKLVDVASATDVSVATLSRVERGEAAKIGGHALLALSRWANLSLALFRAETSTVEPIVGKKPPVPDVVELHLRADKNLDPKTAELLGKMFRAAYDHARKDK